MAYKYTTGSSDTGDLYRDGDELFALQRNSDAVVRIDYDSDSLTEMEAWTYGHVTNAPAFRYENSSAGHGRGLCMDQDRVYVILDNNDLSREADPDDSRPLLLIFQRPQ